jgi:DNA-binding NarL/FixJ family response regulator
MTSGFNF